MQFKPFFLAPLLCAIAFVVSPCPFAAAQEKAPGEALKDEEAKKKLAVIDRNGFLVIPVAYYKPETSFAGGGAFITYFRTDDDKVDEENNLPLHLRPSSVATTLTYTEKRQIIWELFPEFYLDYERYHLLGSIEYQKYPNQFWGVGNDTRAGQMEKYTENTLRVRSDLQREVAHKLYLGLIYHYEHNRISEFEEGGIIDQGGVRGTREAAAQGLGFSVNFDVRDHDRYTTRGGLYQLTCTAFNPVFNSDYNFVKWTLDIRQFFPLWWNHVLALQGYGVIISGKPPFEMMALLGGKRIMRGYYEGRYRDEDLLTAQAEYRMPLFWRLGLVGFAGAGEVSPTLNRFTVDGIRYAYGGGLRASINQMERMNIRVDVGRSPGFTGVYVTLGEAF